MLVTLAFTGSIGMAFVIMACALPKYALWWPFFVVLFYILAPIPTLIARRYSDHSGSSNSCLESAIFITVGILVCSFALPIVLARGDVIQWGSCYLTLVGNVIVYGTLIGFFLAFEADDSDYNMW
ncbi:leptin receptor gene-related protein isoform X2 [Sitophilus oryzae]|uniref:Leptin receptor gene-related protein isoform X2 n=1 Tax=Sitophilus oryzae TaxID=7048 RepID=A0A6J2XPZ2_SITOR|nr:leptin receptor gene-related protein isoform X2 [Sitophilus oryzae]